MGHEKQSEAQQAVPGDLVAIECNVAGRVKGFEVAPADVRAILALSASDCAPADLEAALARELVAVVRQSAFVRSLPSVRTTVTVSVSVRSS